MSEEILVLDLDSADPRQSPRPERVRLREVRVRLWVILAVAVAVAVPAVGLTRAWDSEHTRAARQAVVSLLVSVAPDADLSGALESAGHRYSTTLRVINIGPLPVTVDAVVTTAGGLSLSGSALNALVLLSTELLSGEAPSCCPVAGRPTGGRQAFMAEASLDFFSRGDRRCAVGGPAILDGGRNRLLSGNRNDQVVR